MEDNVIGISVRSDLIGDYDKKDNLLGYQAEMFLKKEVEKNKELFTKYLCEKYDLAPFTLILPRFCEVKYSKYLKDSEARKHIYDKYAEKQSIIEIVCSRITDLNSKDCIRIKETFEEKGNVKRLIDSIVSNYITELKFMLKNDFEKEEKV